MTITDPAAMLTARREQIEKRLQDDLDRMGEHYIDIGRCLNIVKDEGLVPHGEWIAWVREHAQMNERNAQRVMRAAREVESGSPLARLDFSKVMALLALPAGEREEFAEQVDADSLTVRQLQAAIKARDDLAREKEAAQRRIERIERDNLDLRGRLSHISAEMKSQADDLTRAHETENAKAQQEIERLRGELDDTEDELKRRAKAESEAKGELLWLRTQVARGTAMAGDDRLTPDELASAARAFIGQVAVLPHMGRELAACNQKTRDAYLKHVNMVADWCERARVALNTFEGEVLSCE